MTRTPHATSLILLAFALLGGTGTAVAQQLPTTPAEPGQVRVQGIPLQDMPEATAPRTPGGQIDYRESMRLFVQNVSAFARKYKPDFTVVVQNALPLMTKPDPDDETKRYPSMAFIRSVDGILQEGVWYGVPEFGKPTDKERQEKALAELALARRSALPVLVMDYADDPKIIDEVFRKADAAGFLATVAPAWGPELNRLPRLPSRPHRENARSIVSLKDARNFVVLRDSGRYGREDEFALAMHETNHDILVTDVYHGRQPLSKQAVDTLRYKKTGGQRLALAYLNLSGASSYAFYWQPGWREGFPVWIKGPYKGDPDRYHVEYWRPEWQSLVFGNPGSYVYGLIRQGFDGVLLDGVDGYRYFEGDIEPNAL